MHGKGNIARFRAEYHATQLQIIGIKRSRRRVRGHFRSPLRKSRNSYSGRRSGLFETVGGVAANGIGCLSPSVECHQDAPTQSRNASLERRKDGGESGVIDNRETVYPISDWWQLYPRHSLSQRIEWAVCGELVSPWDGRDVGGIVEAHLSPFVCDG